MNVSLETIDSIPLHIRLRARCYDAARAEAKFEAGKDALPVVPVEV